MINYVGFPSVCQGLSDLAYRFALIKLAPKSKRPVERGWQTKTPPDQATVQRWLSAGYGIGLRLGKQPSGDYLIAIDIDSPQGAKWLADQGGVPICPAIKSTRGMKYILKLPKGLKVSKLVTAAGVEILGERHQIVLPSPNAPDQRYWLISPQELHFEIPVAHEWLIRIIRSHQRRKAPAKRASLATRTEAISAPPQADQTRLGRALSYFMSEILPHKTATDSNHPVLLAAAIVAHRLDELRSDALVQALTYVNEQLPKEERESRRQLRAIARCTESKRYGFNAKVYSERTGTDYLIARQIYALFSRFDRVCQNIYMSRDEISKRIQRTIALKGQWIAPGVAILDSSLHEMARLSGVRLATIRHRCQRGTPFVQAVTQNGVKTRFIFIWTPLGFRIFATLLNSIKYRGEERGSFGGLGVEGEVVGEGGRSRDAGYRIRDGPV